MLDVPEVRRNDVYAKLREDILNCVFKPGQSLHESELVEQFGISKSPIRDALLRLEAERLVIVEPRKGYRVAPISLSDSSDLFELRMIMEAGVAQNIATLGDMIGLQSLDRFRSFDAWRAKGGFLAYNRDFHLGLAELCANRRVRDVTRDVIEQFDRIVVISMSVSPELDAQLYLKEHCAIIDALQARKARVATRLISEHIQRARSQFIGSFQRSAVVA
jgi:DNA-binding GntR family transcriptional regulator